MLDGALAVVAHLCALFWHNVLLHVLVCNDRDGPECMSDLQTLDPGSHDYAPVMLEYPPSNLVSTTKKLPFMTLKASSALLTALASWALAGFPTVMSCTRHLASLLIIDSQPLL